MRILITNDDGIHAAQLVPLIRWAQKLGEVTTVVPKFEQSGKSHGIELMKPFEVTKQQLAPDITAYAVDSTPADCVRYAVLGLGLEFDLVISGMNRGLNIGRDTMYSGTVAAVFEAASLDLQAIAISTDPVSYDTALGQLDMVWDFFQRNELMRKNDIYNVNLPIGQPKGIRITRQGGPYYSDDFLDIGNNMVKPKGKCVHVDTGNLELDTDAVINGYISISPLTIDRTNWDVYRKLTKNA